MERDCPDERRRALDSRALDLDGDTSPYIRRRIDNKLGLDVAVKVRLVPAEHRFSVSLVPSIDITACRELPVGADREPLDSPGTQEHPYTPQRYPSERA
jgi:hypothetical protein